MTFTSSQISKALKQRMDEALEAAYKIRELADRFVKAQRAHTIGRAKAFLEAEGSIKDREYQADAICCDLEMEEDLAHELLKAQHKIADAHRTALSAAQTSASSLKSEMDLGRYGE